MAKIYADIEHAILQEELLKFKKLADILDMNIQQTIEMCMFEKRDEYLTLYETNIPTEQE